MRKVVTHNYEKIREYMRAHPDQEIKTVAHNLDIPGKVVWRVFQVDARREDPDYNQRTKTSEILRYLQAHPRCDNFRVRTAVDCSPALVTDTRALWKDLLADPITAPHYAPGKQAGAKAPPPAAGKQDLAASAVEPTPEPTPEPVAEEQIEKILDTRAEQYGVFIRSADVAIKLKQVIHNAMVREDTKLYPDQLQALDMIATKIGRILTGNSSHIDSWIDIAGYAKLVVDRLQGNAR
jgi:hypothetical protein